MLKFIILLISLIIFPTFSHALSDAEYKEMIANYPDYKRADAELGRHWKKIFKPLKGEKRKILLEDQREWVRSKRDEIAREFMEAGLSKAKAYERATIRRIHELDALIYNLFHEDQPKSDDFYFAETDYPEYFKEKGSKPQNVTPSKPKSPQVSKQDTNQPSGEAPQSKPTHKSEPESGTLPLKLKASAAIHEAESNFQSFEAKYKNKILTIQGVIAGMDEDNGTYILKVNTSEDSDSRKNIICKIDNKFEDAIFTLNIGDEISVSGLYDGSKTNKGIFVLTNCSIEM